MKPIYFEKFNSGLNNFGHILQCNDILFHINNLPWLDATEARREYFMSTVSREYTYGSGNGVRTYESKPFTDKTDNIRMILNNQLNVEFDICFLNKYDGQKNHLGWHSDSSFSMDQTAPIVSVSFGAEREIWWKLKDFKGEIPKENRQLLAHGSLFVMPPGFQELYYHKIPKSDKPCGTRISMVFRKFKEPVE